MKPTETKKAVREGYARIATRGSSCCAPVTSCCGGTAPTLDISRQVGYSEEDLRTAPEGANLGLGCGNPVALASLSEGETVLDLGSGAGFDCFLAAARVGRTGRVIGVDMTPEMIEKASDNARKGMWANVEFRLGDIERLPVDDSSVDVVISNCVINLSPDKKSVFREAFRALRPAGRLMISDIVLLKELPAAVRASVDAYVGCLAGAILKESYLDAIRTAGFREVKVLGETAFPLEFMANDPTAQALLADLNISLESAREVAASAVSVKVAAAKPT